MQHTGLSSHQREWKKWYKKMILISLYGNIQKVWFLLWNILCELTTELFVIKSTVDFVSLCYNKWAETRLICIWILTLLHFETNRYILRTT